MIKLLLTPDGGRIPVRIIEWITHCRAKVRPLTPWNAPTVDVSTFKLKRITRPKLGRWEDCIWMPNDLTKPS